MLPFAWNILMPVGMLLPYAYKLKLLAADTTLWVQARRVTTKDS